MLENNSTFIEKHRDIPSFRDLAPGTVATYVSYPKIYIEWVEDQLPNRSLSSVSWEEIRSFIRWLKDMKKLNPRTVKGTDFIGMFLQHVLPKGFNRVRFSGIAMVF